jgi:hypothetical protein
MGIKTTWYFYSDFELLKRSYASIQILLKFLGWTLEIVKLLLALLQSQGNSLLD